jgi:hypothetical protein
VVEAAVGGDPFDEEGELGLVVRSLGLADGTAAPLPCSFGGLLVAATAELMPAVRARGDPDAMDQV